MACRVIGKRVARSVAVAGPPAASAARMPRRLGSARAVKTSCATASRSELAIEVGDQLAQLVRPTVGVAGEGLLVTLVRQLRESAFHHGERSAGAGRLQRELDVRAPRVALGEAVEAPGVPENVRRLDALEVEGGGVTAVPAELRLAADSQVDLGGVAEPGAEPLDGGQRRPDPLRRVLELDGALD